MSVKEYINELEEKAKFFEITQPGSELHETCELALLSLNRIKPVLDLSADESALENYLEDLVRLVKYTTRYFDGEKDFEQNIKRVLLKLNNSDSM